MSKQRDRLTEPADWSPLEVSNRLAQLAREGKHAHGYVATPLILRDEVFFDRTTPCFVCDDEINAVQHDADLWTPLDLRSERSNPALGVATSVLCGAMLWALITFALWASLHHT